MKATARAGANIAFVKYWGNRDNLLRLPLNSSISMTLDAAHTVTTVEFDRSLADSLQLNGQPAGVGPGVAVLSTWIACAPWPAFVARSHRLPEQLSDQRGRCFVGVWLCCADPGRCRGPGPVVVDCRVSRSGAPGVGLGVPLDPGGFVVCAPAVATRTPTRSKSLRRSTGRCSILWPSYRRRPKQVRVGVGPCDLDRQPAAAGPPGRPAGNAGRRACRHPGARSRNPGGTERG